MKKSKIFLTAFAALLAAGAVTYAANEVSNTKVRLSSYEYASENLPVGFDGFRILFVSDLHNAPFSEQIARYIEKERPDITVLGGDMIQLPESDLYECLKLVRLTKDITDFYAITGNHEMQHKDLWLILEQLEQAGVCMIDSRDESIWRGDDKINLAGLADPGVDELRDKDAARARETVAQILADDRGVFTVLVSHRATLYPNLKDLDIDLILSGDCHGGIIRLPFVGGIIGSERHGFLPEYEYGFYREDGGAAMIVSGGCDKNPKKKRFFNPPEVVLVTLKTAEPAN